MHFLGFCVSFGLLFLAWIFILAGVASDAWWLRADGLIKAGLWEQCFKEHDYCQPYGSKTDGTLKKLSGTSDQDNNGHLNVVRGLALFSFIVLSIAGLLLGFFIFALKFKSTKEIGRRLQIALAAIILLSGKRSTKLN